MSAALDDARCRRCFGIGSIEVLEGSRIHDRTCPDCHGSGWQPDHDDCDCWDAVALSIAVNEPSTNQEPT